MNAPPQSRPGHGHEAHDHRGGGHRHGFGADPRADPRPDHEHEAHDHSGGGHRHGIGANDGPGAGRALLCALIIIGGFAVVEFFGGLWSGSLALLADSGHMVTDAAALVFSLVANRMARRPVSERHSYGLARAEVIAAFVNSLALLAVVAWLIVEGIDRIAHPRAVDGRTVMLVAGGGVIANVLAAWILARGRSNLNIRAALLHVIGDLLGSVAALAAGLIIVLTGYSVVDPLLSMLVSGLILHSTFGVLRESTVVLLDGVPDGVDYARVGRSLAAIPGVLSVHDLHVWTMVPGREAASAHLMIEHIERWPAILLLARQMLRRDFAIDHVTLQPECFARAGAARAIPIRPYGGEQR